MGSSVIELTAYCEKCDWAANAVVIPGRQALFVQDQMDAEFEEHMREHEAERHQEP